jgi:RNA polymerase sigma factor (sigma-70 family)
MSYGWESKLKETDGGQFRTTHWSVILAAAQPGSTNADAALAALCQAYWYPLYVFVLGCSKSTEEAKDLTQAFFAQLLSKRFLEAVNPTAGRFRNFLLTSAKNFLADDRARREALKRGGAYEIVSLDDTSWANECLDKLVDHATPEKGYERQWALTLLDRAMSRLREEYTSSGRGQLFETLKRFLLEKKPTPHTAIAEGLGINTSTVGVAIYRLRQRFREVLRQEVAQTVDNDNDDEVQAELSYLLSALAG